MEFAPHACRSSAADTTMLWLEYWFSSADDDENDNNDDVW